MKDAKMFYRVNRTTNSGFVAGFYNTINRNTGFYKSNANWILSCIFQLYYRISLFVQKSQDTVIVSVWLHFSTYLADWHAQRGTQYFI